MAFAFRQKSSLHSAWGGVQGGFWSKRLFNIHLCCSVLPSITDGHLKLQVEFNVNTTIPLRLICHSEYPAVISIDHNSKVTMSDTV
jgi:hypothetical protein